MIYYGDWLLTMVFFSKAMLSRSFLGWSESLKRLVRETGLIWAWSYKAIRTISSGSSFSYSIDRTILLPIVGKSLLSKLAIASLSETLLDCEVNWYLFVDNPLEGELKSPPESLSLETTIDLKSSSVAPRRRYSGKMKLEVPRCCLYCTLFCIYPGRI